MSFLNPETLKINQPLINLILENSLVLYQGKIKNEMI